MVARFQFSLKAVWAATTAVAVLAAVWSYLPAQVRERLFWLLLPPAVCMAMMAMHYAIVRRLIDSLSTEPSEDHGEKPDA